LKYRFISSALQRERPRFHLLDDLNRCVSDMAVQTQHNHSMGSKKPSLICIEQELPDNIERSEFIRRGLASIARSEAARDWIPAEDVIAKLQAKVAAARERRDRHNA
jgi:hypothetical protein